MESQIEEKESHRAEHAKAPIDPTELERRRTRESLELARKRVLHELETTQHSRRKSMLCASLKHLDEKITELK